MNYLCWNGSRGGQNYRELCAALGTDWVSWRSDAGVLWAGWCGGQNWSVYLMYGVINFVWSDVLYTVLCTCTTHYILSICTVAYNGALTIQNSYSDVLFLLFVCKKKCLYYCILQYKKAQSNAEPHKAGCIITKKYEPTSQRSYILFIQPLKYTKGQFYE